MSPHSLAAGPDSEVLADSVYGDLQVEGWERPEILLQSNNEEAASLRQDGQIIRLKASGDCLLRLPYQARLTDRQRAWRRAHQGSSQPRDDPQGAGLPGA